jgi:hypothetical protein
LDLAQFATRRVSSIVACGATDTTRNAEECAGRWFAAGSSSAHAETPAMKRVFSLAALLAMVAGSSGCSIVDRLFLLNADGPYAHQAKNHGGPCQDGDCQEYQDGSCPTGDCESGACQDCPGGTCRVPHTGRYGGLAKHHLSPEEKAALAAGDYGATQPAGPPTGAVAYPYYTTRGPRDFLAKNPASIGPQ